MLREMHFKTQITAINVGKIKHIQEIMAQISKHRNTLKKRIKMCRTCSLINTQNIENKHASFEEVPKTFAHDRRGHVVL